MIQKCKEWLNRYKYAEVSAIITFLTWSYLCDFLGISLVIKAVSTTYVEFIAYYMGMYFSNKSSYKNSMYSSLKSILIEFGPAEIVDLLFSRTFFLFYIPILFNGSFIGLIAGKLAADIIFYSLTICSFEWFKKYDNRTITTQV